MIKIIFFLLRDLWVSPVMNRAYVWEMGNPTFLKQKYKKTGQCFQIEKPLVGIEEGSIDLIFY